MSFVAKKIRDQKLGVKCKSDASYRMINKTVKVYKEDGEILAIFVKKAITDPKIIAAGRDLIRYKSTTTNRGMAAGVNPEKTQYKGRFGTANPVNSSIVGYFDAGGFYKCRQTALYAKHMKDFDHTTLPLIEYVSRCFKKLAPKQHKKQEEFINSINQRMRLGKSVYTTITVNVDFRTFAHKDQGDYASGLGNLLVFNVGNFSGAELLLPEYKIGFQVEEGDILLFDVHETHCNNPMKGEGRISLVCYAREGIKDKCKGVTKKELAENTGNQYR